MTAPERIYLTTNKSDGEWSNVSQRTVPDWLSKHVDEHQYIRTDIHEAEIGALKTELAALKEWRYSDQELAIKILSYLGFSQESSKEPYADRRRDHIAEMICQNCEPLKTELAALKEGPDYKGVLFALCASLSLEDTIGDVWEDVIEALDQAGICADIGSMDGFQDVLKIMPKPVMTLYGPIEEDE